jgi:hypothetical protein
MERFLKMDPVLSVVDHGAEVIRLDIVDLGAKVEGCATHVVQPWIRHGAKHITTNQGDEVSTTDHGAELSTMSKGTDLGATNLGVEIPFKTYSFAPSSSRSSSPSP